MFESVAPKIVFFEVEALGFGIYGGWICKMAICAIFGLSFMVCNTQIHAKCRWIGVGVAFVKSHIHSPTLFGSEKLIKPFFEL